MNPPDAGIHHGVPARIYHSWDACSNSRLNVLQRSSAARLRYEIDQPPAQTDAQRIGTAAHVAILEPDLWSQRYARGPKGDGRTTAVKEAKAALEAEHPAAEILRPADYDLCRAMQASVWAHPMARDLLLASPDREMSIVWEHPVGMLCKGRIDARSVGAGALLDLKTTTDASREQYEKSVYSWGYHRAAAMYLDGATAVGIEAADFVQIVVEKSPPHCVAVYRISDGAVQAGRQQIIPLMAYYAKCLESGDWPGYSDEIQEISLPPWAWRQLEQEAA